MEIPYTEFLRHEGRGGFGGLESTFVIRSKLKRIQLLDWFCQAGKCGDGTGLVAFILI